MTGAHRWRAHVTRLCAALLVALRWLRLVPRLRGSDRATAALSRAGLSQFVRVGRLHADGGPAAPGRAVALAPVQRTEPAAGGAVSPDRAVALAPVQRIEPVPGAANLPALLQDSREFDAVQVEPTFGEALYAATFALLQLGPRSKLFDLRAARLIPPEVFSRLADAWTAAPIAMPRLAILLDYERWVIYRHVALRRLQPLIARGVDVEIFYSQQLSEVDRWFAVGEVRHDRIPDVLAWLRSAWKPTLVWPAVLGTTASLIQLHARTDRAPDLLTELAVIALEFGGDVEGATEAARYARMALQWHGDAPSIARCRALQVLGRATMLQGDADGALVLYERAIAMAVVLKAPMEEATALQAVGKHALRGRHADRAAIRFRSALDLLANANAPQALRLRASLHHDLAAALHALGDGDNAEAHAIAAFGLHSMATSPLAREDRALLAQIRARGAATARDDSNHRASTSAPVSPVNPGRTAIRARQRRRHR